MWLENERRGLPLTPISFVRRTATQWMKLLPLLMMMVQHWDTGDNAHDNHGDGGDDSNGGSGDHDDSGNDDSGGGDNADDAG